MTMFMVIPRHGVDVPRGANRGVSAHANVLNTLPGQSLKTRQSGRGNATNFGVGASPRTVVPSSPEPAVRLALDMSSGEGKYRHHEACTKSAPAAGNNRSPSVGNRLPLLNRSLTCFGRCPSYRRNKRRSGRVTAFAPVDSTNSAAVGARQHASRERWPGPRPRQTPELPTYHDCRHQPRPGRERPSARQTISCFRSWRSVKRVLL